MSYPEHDKAVSHYSSMMCFISVYIVCYVAEKSFSDVNNIEGGRIPTCSEYLTENGISYRTVLYCVKCNLGFTQLSLQVLILL